MEKYTSPEITLVIAESNDIITTSPGTESSIIDTDPGVWDLNIG
jgi:hypothetical protein